MESLRPIYLRICRFSQVGICKAPAGRECGPIPEVPHNTVRKGIGIYIRRAAITHNDRRAPLACPPSLVYIPLGRFSPRNPRGTNNTKPKTHRIDRPPLFLFRVGAQFLSVSACNSFTSALCRYWGDSIRAELCSRLRGVWDAAAEGAAMGVGSVGAGE